MSWMISFLTLAQKVTVGDEDNSDAYRWGQLVGYLTMAILTVAVILHFVRKGRK